MSTCFRWSTSAFTIGYKLNKKRLIEDLRLNGLNMKKLDDLNAHQILLSYVYFSVCIRVNLDGS